MYWKETEFGHELLEDYSDNQLALLKFDKEENDYYISAIENQDSGRDYLFTDRLQLAKHLTINAVIDRYKGHIRDYEWDIEQLQSLYRSE